jgi:serine/threonine protein kinase
VLSLIRHPNVCGVHELGDEHGVLYQVREWSDGASLRHVLDRLEGARLDYSAAARIVSKACAGLHAAHEIEDDDGVPLKVVHRDLAARSLLISSRGQVQVTGFALMEVEPDPTGSGNSSYPAPEQRARGNVDHRADVFALGCILYESTVGSAPTVDGAAPPSPLTRLPDYPSALASIVTRAMARKPGDRYQTAEAFSVALEGWLAKSRAVVTEQNIAELAKRAAGSVIDQKAARIREATARFAQPTPGLDAIRPPHLYAQDGSPVSIRMAKPVDTAAELTGASRPTIPVGPRSRKPAR